MNKKSHNKFYVFFYSYILERTHLKLPFLVCIYICVCVCVCVYVCRYICRYKLYGPFLWMRFNSIKAAEPL